MYECIHRGSCVDISALAMCVCVCACVRACVRACVGVAIYWLNLRYVIVYKLRFVCRYFCLWYVSMCACVCAAIYSLSSRYAIVYQSSSDCLKTLKVLEFNVRKIMPQN